MKKWILGGIGVLVVIIIVVVIVGISNLGPMIKTAVNTYGPDITKTEIRLGDVDVSIFSAKAELKDFFLGNPDGFKSPQAMKVGSIFVDVDEGSLTSDTIIIDRIEIAKPEITYEKAKGTDNYKSILSNIRNSIGSEKTVSNKQKEEKETGKKMIINDFIVRDGKVTLVMPLLSGKTITAPLPDIHLKDIGKEKGGASPGEAVKTAMTGLYQKITSPAVTDVFNKGLESLGKTLDNVGESAKEGMKSVTDKFKGLLNK
jgi:hypothetical protein